MADTECNLAATKTDECDASRGREQEDETSLGIQFCPPLYLQRYMLAVRCLTREKITSVVDFGCAECGFFKLLNTVPSLRHICLVDVDRNLLLTKKSAICPELRHFIHRRDFPLHNCLYIGSAEDTDRRIVGYEAVTMIEVIEHLHLQVLQRVTENIFGTLQPKLCIVTTPNSEFNVLFENEDPKSFRHWDHKFEWTRQEFNDWCSQVCEKYSYTVEFAGVGNVPSKPETWQFGPCSQAAIFRLQSVHGEKEIGKGDYTKEFEECYELVSESDFPYQEQVLTTKEKIDLEISHFLHQVALNRRNEGVEDHQISLSKICNLRCIKSFCDENGVRESLQRNSYQLSEDGSHIIIDLDELLGDSYSDEDQIDDEDQVDDDVSGVEDRGSISDECDSHREDVDGSFNALSDPDGKPEPNLERSESDWDLEIKFSAVGGSEDRQENSNAVTAIGI